MVNMLVLTNLVISAYFWLFLNEFLGLFTIHMTFIHTVPSIGSLIEYIFFSAYPCELRHFCAMLAMAVVYLIVMFIITKVEGKPIYPGMTWDSVIGTLIPLSITFSCFVLYIIFYKFNQFKLRLMGYKNYLTD